MNKVILHGRLARDVELRSTNSGKSVATFTIAVNKPRNKDGEQQADFIPCIVWEKRAETIAKHFAKGSEILLEGRIQVRSYEKQDGSKAYVTEVVVNDFDFCGSKKDNGTPANGISGTPTDEDIPF